MNKNDKIQIVKTVAGITTRISVVYIVRSMVQATTPQRTTVEKTLAVFGGLVLGSLVATHAEYHVYDRIDAAVKAVDDYNTEKGS